VLYTLLVTYVGAYVAQQSTIVAAVAPMNWLVVVLLVLNVLVAIILVVLIAVIFLHEAVTSVEWVKKWLAKTEMGRKITAGLTEQLRGSLLAEQKGDEIELGPRQ
jgi:sensor histidine kinase YesM